MTDTLIAQLRSLGIADWATARVRMAEAADLIEALQDQLDVQAGSIEAVQSANQRLAAERDKLRAEVEATRKANLDCMDNYNQLRQDYDALQSRLMALEGQEPACYVTRLDDFEPIILDKAILVQGNKAIPLFLAAPQQAEPKDGEE